MFLDTTTIQRYQFEMIVSITANNNMIAYDSVILARSNPQHDPQLAMPNANTHIIMCKRVLLYKWLLCSIAFDSEENCTNSFADVSFFIAENSVFEQF